MVAYRLIGEGLALMLMILAFRDARDKGRIFLISFLFLSFLLPSFFSSPVSGLIGFITRMVVGLGCYVYVKFQGYIG